MSLTASPVPAATRIVLFEKVPVQSMSDTTAGVVAPTLGLMIRLLDTRRPESSLEIVIAGPLPV